MDFWLSISSYWGRDLFNLGSEVSKGDWKVFTSLNLVKNKPRRISECVRSFEGEEMGKMAFR